MPTTDQEIRWRDTRLAEQSRRIEELEEALKPFADEGRRIDVTYLADTHINKFSITVQITVADFRRAAAALVNKQQEDKP